jgi:hypothetical protein
MELAESILAGDRLALARLLTLLENQAPEGAQALNRLYPQSGRAHRIGVTGAPGTGKSALVNRLALHLRQGGRAVGGGRGGGSAAPSAAGRSGRPHSHAGSGRRPGRVHPQHGQRGDWEGWHARPLRWSMHWMRRFR